jgi:hypothetical protein
VKSGAAPLPPSDEQFAALIRKAVKFAKSEVALGPPCYLGARPAN